MILDISTGWIEDIVHMPSPNFNERPSGDMPEAVIVHAISLPPGAYGGGEIEDLFCNRLDCGAHEYFERLRGVRVSAHFLIRRDGAAVQFVSIAKRAWHAGESVCMGRADVNDFSIGIELEGCDEDAFEEAQYQTLDELVELFVQACPSITRDTIFGHSEIAPDRKTDPGPNFDWRRIRTNA